MYEITITTPEDAPVRKVIEAHVAYGDQHYPTVSNYHLAPSEYLQSETSLFAAWRDGECVGISAMRLLTNVTAELKSVHVLPSARGTGLGRELVQAVLALAQAKGVTTVFLETGSRDASRAARCLYEDLGFVYCPPFGDYKDDPESVFMMKNLQRAENNMTRVKV